jgi:LuxR family maltose regulon positive regulatory protein
MRGRVTERVTDFIAAFSGSHRHVIDYLAEEVMAQQPNDIHDFLCQTSILDRLTTPLCNAVTEREDSEAILKRLEQANLFLVPLDDQRKWYRYHHLFADFLRSHLNQDLPDQVFELHHRASKWYEQKGLSASAIEHALSAQDFERAARLIEEAADTTMLHSEIATFQSWVEALPDGVVRTRPILSVYYAFTLLLNGQPLEVVEARMQDAVEADTAGSVAGEIAVLRAFIATCQGDTPQSAELSSRALELLSENSLFFRSFVAGYLGLSYLFSGDIKAATWAFNEAVRVGQQVGSLIITVLGQCRLGQIYMMQGYLHKARMYLEQALDLATDEQGRLRPIAGVALTGLGWLWQEWNDLEGATRYLLEGIELTRKWSEIGSLQGYIGLALVKQAQGDVKGADEAIQTAEQLAIKFDAMEMDDIMVAAYQARLWVAQGKLEAALRWVEERGLALSPAQSKAEESIEGLDRDVRLSESEKETGSASLPLHSMLEHISLARVYLAQRQPNDALAVLKPLLQTAEQAGMMWFAIEILILQALAHQDQGDIPQALTALEQALSLAEPEGYVRIFISEGAPMAKLLRQAAVGGMAADYVGKLQEAFGAEEHIGPLATLSPAPPAIEAQLVEPLSERELEVLRLIAAGLSNREIAEELVVAVSTVKTHINNIYRKFDVSSRTQAIAQARALKLL